LKEGFLTRSHTKGLLPTTDPSFKTSKNEKAPVWNAEAKGVKRRTSIIHYAVAKVVILFQG